MVASPSCSSAASSDVDHHRAGELLVAVRLGSDGAFDELVQLCDPLVRRCARRHSWRRDDVDDIAQEVWYRFIRTKDSIDEPRALIAWLHVVTRRIASELGHRGGRQLPTPLADDRPSSSSTEDEAIAHHVRDETIAGVRGALGRLDEDQRRLLLLLHRDDRPDYGDIGREVGRPVGSLGPTRRRLLDRLGHDARIARLRGLPPAS